MPELNWERVIIAIRQLGSTPSLRIKKDGSVSMTLGLVRKLKLAEDFKYDVFIERKERLIGLRIHSGGFYQGRNGSKNHGPNMVGVRLALGEIGFAGRAVALTPKFPPGPINEATVIAFKLPVPK